MESFAKSRSRDAECECEESLLWLFPTSESLRWLPVLMESRDESFDGSCRPIDPESVRAELELDEELVDELDELFEGKVGDELCMPPPPMGEDDDEEDGEGLDEMLGELDVVV